MNDLREAVKALAEEVRGVEAAVASGEDVPSKGQLAELQKRVDRIQQSLKEKEEV
jgi:hypothetical protein